MDIKVLRKSDESANAALFEGMHRQRHAVFALQLGWSALRSGSGLERDAFDDQHAVYLIAHEGGEVAGSLRLLPSWGRSMLRECWPQAMAPDAPPLDETTWEWTRWCPGTASRPRQLVAVRRALILEAVAFGLSQEAARFVTLCETKFIDQLDALGWEPQPLGEAFAYAEGTAIGVGWALRRNAVLETAARLRAPRGRDRAASPPLAEAA